MKAIVLVMVLLSSVTYELAVAAPVAAAEPETRVVTFAIDGMVTPNCPVLVRKAVGSMKGVEKVEASLEKKTATVAYVVGVTTPDAIRKVIQDRTGFRAKLTN